LCWGEAHSRLLFQKHELHDDVGLGLDCVFQ
jgi:hypothetical protein